MVSGASTPTFNEDTLRDAIASVWGEHGAHMDVYDHVVKRLAAAEEVIHAETEYRAAKNSQQPSRKKEAAERRAAARTQWHALGGRNDG